MNKLLDYGIEDFENHFFFNFENENKLLQSNYLTSIYDISSQRVIIVNSNGHIIYNRSDSREDESLLAEIIFNFIIEEKAGKHQISHLKQPKYVEKLSCWMGYYFGYDDNQVFTDKALRKSYKQGRIFVFDLNKQGDLNYIYTI